MNYRVVCNKCKGSRKIKIVKTAIGNRIDWLEDKQDASFTIVSGRHRLDGEFGWQCVCGNNDLMTRQERESFENPASPKPQEIESVIKNLKPDKPKFGMVAI